MKHNPMCGLYPNKVKLKSNCPFCGAEPDKGMKQNYAEELNDSGCKLFGGDCKCKEGPKFACIKMTGNTK